MLGMSEVYDIAYGEGMEKVAQENSYEELVKEASDLFEQGRNMFYSDLDALQNSDR